VREVRQVDRDFQESGAEVEESLTTPSLDAQSEDVAAEPVPVASGQLEELEDALARLETEVLTLKSEKAESSLLQEEDRQLVRQLLTQLAEREQEQREGSAAANTNEAPDSDDRRQRWEAAGKRLKELIFLLVGWLAAESPDVLLETVFGDEVYPWVKAQWRSFFAQAEAAGVIEQSPLTSPLTSPLPSPTAESPPPVQTPTPKPETPTPPRRGRIPIPEMVTVGAGHFWMGSDKRVDRDAEDDELPQHRLYLSAYRIGKYPVMNEEYAAFAAATGHRVPYPWKGNQPPAEKLNHPVVNVSWDDAVAYCRWLSEATGQHYRLSSEAEWEKAARGTDGRIYPWGNPPPNERRCNFKRNVDGTTPVGSYPAGVSPYGCYDMAGNVWEWTQSLRRGYPYRSDDGREEQAESGSGVRVLRGGNYWNDSSGARCASRYRHRTGDGSYDGGFRLATGLFL